MAAMLAALVLGASLLAPPHQFAAPPSERADDDQGQASPDTAPELSAATHGHVELRAFERGTRDPLAGASVFVDDRDEPIAETDEAGRAQTWLEPGAHRLSLRAPDYEAVELELEVEAGERQTVELRPLRARRSRYRTEVGSEREVAITRTQLREDELTTVPGSGGDPFAVIKSLPGAAQVAGFLPYVVVRGAAPGNTGYYLDGVRVPALFHLALGPSLIHPYFIDEIDFYPGGVPVRLGRFASGLVEGQTKLAARDRVRGELDVRLIDAGGLIDIPFNRPRDRSCERAAGSDRAARRACRGDARGSLTLAGRYSYTGLLLTPFGVKLRYWDYQARLDHRLGPRARYTAFVFGSFDSLGPTKLEYDEVDPDSGVITPVVERNPDPWVQLEFHRIDQRIRQRLRGGGRIDYRVALGLDRSGVQALGVNLWRISPRIDARVPVGERANIHAGLDQDFQVFRLPGGSNPDLFNPEDQALLLSERFVSVTGLYLDWSYANKGFEIRPGIRSDWWVSVGPSPYLSETTAVASAIAIDPRVLIRERIGPRLSLRQSLGVYHQPPDPPVAIPGLESIGLDDGLQRNVQATLGWQWRLGEHLILTQDAYLGRLTNMQDYELSQSIEGSGDPSTADELDDYLIRVSGWAFGLESMLRLIPDGQLYGWLAYTLSWSLRDYPLGGWAPATWDQRHVLNAVLGWTINRKWRIGGRFHLNSGRPYTTRSVDDQGGVEALVDALGEHRNNARLPTFVQLDLRFERIFTLRRARLHLYLDLANTTFAREILRCNSLAETDDPARNQVVGGCVSPQALRYVLPSLGLRAVF